MPALSHWSNERCGRRPAYLLVSKVPARLIAGLADRVLPASFLAAATVPHEIFDLERTS
jgi:hypothetical protein